MIRAAGNARRRKALAAALHEAGAETTERAEDAAVERGGDVPRRALPAASTTTDHETEHA